MFDFEVVPGEAVLSILHDNRSEVLDIVARAYLAHHAGQTVNPDSYFLRFPDKPESRIIALPAFLGDDVQMAGIKWVSSFPKNIESSLPRASAVLILNDYQTGYPIACLEAAAISATRTAASAALAAVSLRPDGYAGTRLAIVGAGVIARNITDYLHAGGCTPDRFLVHDLDETSGRALVDHLRSTHDASAEFVSDLGAILDAETIVFATTALEPYVRAPFKPGQLLLNISLRDLTPEVILSANNVLDDVEHCLKANTSPHLAEQASGSRAFVSGTLAQVLNREITLDSARPTIFSPFGLGVLDLAVGAFVLKEARDRGTSNKISGFFGETRRW
ncbi:2,3-diaminopropionate biosynthesis protein SbnB [Sphaerimonospora cavernae]|uniref:2,3-diaminopropionate biosynthesis protein SbnB n=1 Tax=Sphaerimonospora cavernae TaxID=1740611 RepID=A0ABV6U077_9ACTN